MTFKQFALRKELLDQIAELGYKQPTPIQEKAIPAILAGKDVLAGAQTGTGKTAAFTLPILQLLSAKSQTKTKTPNCLILAPTRELAAQVGESVQRYGKGLPIRSTIIFGGVNEKPQKRVLHQGVDIVIGTPGRLLDLTNQGDLVLSSIDIVVLDEADRMLDMGFIHDIRKIIQKLPRKRQTLFFSATYTHDIKKLADSILNQPIEIEVARRNTSAETVDQCAYFVSKPQKKNALIHLVKEQNWYQVLVFARTKHGANRLAKQFESANISSTTIHGNKSQNARTRALAEFKEGKVQVMVATDIAARGLDINELPVVVNYELPNVSQDYIHRIGRTGRAGNNGLAISLVMEDERQLLKSIEGLMKKKIPVKYLKGFSDDTPLKDASIGTPTKKPKKKPYWKSKKASQKKY